MNLSDLIDTKYQLAQDEWSLARPKFGKDGQLEVIGWSGRCNSAKYYIIKCDTCCKDSELFGDGYFRSSKASLLAGTLPCKCSGKYFWSKEQYYVLCRRKAIELGYNFIDFTGKWLSQQKTRIVMECEEHGMWDSGTVANLLQSSHGCPVCRFYNREPYKLDEDIISSFLVNGEFPDGTTFTRSKRLTLGGVAGQYWIVSCPVCKEVSESLSGNLRSGKRPCGCTKQRQRQAYINIVSDNDNPICLKFGIANNSSRRAKDQNRCSIYDIVNNSIFSFGSIQDCKAAERECKQKLVCGVISKEEMHDGYTETTYLYNLEKIIDIYEKYGGCRVDSQ